jgi:hypothetical protein
MDTTTTALMSTGTGGTILGVLLLLYKTLVGKKIRSRCCGQDIEVGFTVEDMSPAEQRQPHFQVQNPIKDKDLPISVIVPSG